MGRRTGWCTGLQTQVREDLLNHRLFQDRRNDLQLTATIRAVLQAAIKLPHEQLGPAQPHRAVLSAVQLARGEHRMQGRQFGLLRLLSRHHQTAQLGVVRQHAKKVDQMQPRSLHQGCQSLHELQRRLDQMRAAVSPRGLQLEQHLARSVSLYALVGQCRAGGHERPAPDGPAWPVQTRRAGTPQSQATSDQDGDAEADLPRRAVDSDGSQARPGAARTRSRGSKSSCAR